MTNAPVTGGGFLPSGGRAGYVISSFYLILNGLFQFYFFNQYLVPGSGIILTDYLVTKLRLGNTMTL